MADEKPLRDVLQEYFRQRDVEKLVKNMPLDVQEYLVEAILEFSILPDLIPLVRDIPEFRRIRELVRQSLDKGEAVHELFPIFERNKAEAENRLSSLKKKLEKRVFGKKALKHILILSQSSRPDKETIIQRVKRNRFSSLKRRGQERLYMGIGRVSHHIEEIDGRGFPLTERDFKRSEDKDELSDCIAYKLLKPDWFALVFDLEDEWEKFPYKWCLILPVGKVQALYELFKAGQLGKDLFSSMYDETELDDLLRRLGQLPAFTGRRRFIEQAFRNYIDENYAACINLLLPQIEGILWQFSVYLHNVGLRIYDAEKVSIWSKYRFDLIGADGNPIESVQNLRTLLKRTAMKDEIFDTVIEHLCGELYDERNLILHGISLKYDTKENAAKKIFVLETIYKRIFDRTVQDMDFIAERAGIDLKKYTLSS